MSKKFIAGNWKLNPADGQEAVELCSELRSALTAYSKVRIALFPPFIGLGMISKIFADTDIAIGAQNLFWKDTGAFTGFANLLLFSSNNSEYRGIDSVVANTATICGTWSATPTGTYTVYDWGTIIDGGNTRDYCVVVDDGQKNVNLVDLELRNPVHYKLIELHAARAIPQIQNPQSKIPNHGQ